MGKQSTRKNKTIYQICREAQGLTREKAAELMDGISDSKIEKIEYELQEPTPYDIVKWRTVIEDRIFVTTTVPTNALLVSATSQK